MLKILAMEINKHTFTVSDDCVGQRFDKVLAAHFEGESRSTVQNWIKQGFVLLDEEVPKQKDKVLGGEEVEVMIPEANESRFEPQDIRIDVVHEDDDVLVINKAAGLVVHPGAGNPDQTLLNGLLFHFPVLSGLPRAGIVHRLDKDTSGLMVVAKNELARLALTQQLVDHSLNREYLALANGRVISGGTVDESIARDKGDRRKMSVSAMGKDAVTHYRVEQRFRNHTLLRVNLETGRTHQIRVHMQHLGFSLVGDPVYGRRLAIAGDCVPELEAQLRTFRRQALHATRIEYRHPRTGDRQGWARSVPKDFASLIAACDLDNTGVNTL